MYRGTGGDPSLGGQSVNEIEKFLGFSQSEGGDENAPSVFEDPGSFPGKGCNLLAPLAGIAGAVAGVGAFENQGVDFFIGQNGSGDQGLIVQGNIAGVKNLRRPCCRKSPAAPRTWPAGINWAWISPRR